MRLRVKASLKKAFGEGEALPPVAEEILAKGVDEAIQALRNGGWWSHEGIEILESELKKAVLSAAETVFKKVEAAGHYPEV